MNNITLISCSYNTPDVTSNMLKSFIQLHPECPILISENSTNDLTENILKQSNIPFIRNVGMTHGPAVDLLFKQVQTDFVLLVDTDVIFLKSHEKIFDNFQKMDLTIMGEVVGDRGGKKLHKRVNPWHCFINLKTIKEHKINFFDIERMKKRGEVIYDVGSSFFEDVKNLKLKIGIFEGNGTYYLHYEGLSWRVNKFNSNLSQDGNIDLNSDAQHCNTGLMKYGLLVKQKYDLETEILSKQNLIYGN